MRAPPIVSARLAPTPIVRPTPAKRAARRPAREPTPHHAVDHFPNALEPQIIPASRALRRNREVSGRPSRRRLTCTSNAKIKDASATTAKTLQSTPPPPRSPKAAKPPSIIPSIIRGEILVALRNLRQAAAAAPIFPPSVAKMRHFVHASGLTK